MFDSLISNPKQGLLQNVAIKENGCHRSSILLFETVLSCSDPEQTSIKQVVFAWRVSGFKRPMVILVLSNKISQLRNMQDAFYSERNPSNTGLIILNN